MREITKQLILRQITPYTLSYWPETTRFLYSGFYLIKKRRMKYSLMVSAFERDLVANDYVATFYNSKKTFSEVSTGLIKYRYYKPVNQPLTAFGRLKQTIFFRTNEMLFLTHRFAAFRNLILNMSINQYSFLGFNAYTRQRNKWMFYALLEQLKGFNFKQPFLPFYKYKKRSRLRVYYLGFRLTVKKKLMRSLLKRSALTKSRRKRYIRFNKLRRSRLLFKRFLRKKIEIKQIRKRRISN
jgi:hypothetical protein